MNSDKSVAIIGAGIVGCTAALGLSAEGHHVTVYDPLPPASATSYGNAGVLGDSLIVPTATPSFLRDIPGYLFDPDAVAKIKASTFPHSLPWLWQFFRNSTVQKTQQNSKALADLTVGAAADYAPYLKHADAQHLVSPTGWLKVFANEKRFESTAFDRMLLTEAAVPFDILEPQEVADMESNLDTTRIHKGLFLPRCGFVKNPRALAVHFLGKAETLGARHLRQKVSQIVPNEAGGVTVMTASGPATFDKVIVAAGHQSGTFARQIGDRVPLIAERGYHIGFAPESANLISRPVGSPSDGMVLSPMETGLRLLNGTEIAAPETGPDFRRIRRLRSRATELLPALRDYPAQSEWMGRRPSTPDSLPVIGPSPHCRDVIYAFGHGHLGLTLAARTANMLRQMLHDAPRNSDDHRAYGISRFRRL